VGEAVARRAAAEAAAAGRARSGATGPVPGAKGSGRAPATRRRPRPGDSDRSGRDRSAGDRSAGDRSAGDHDRRRGDVARPARRTPATGAAARPKPSPVHRRRRRVAALVGALVVLAGLAVGVRVLLLDLGLFDVEDVQVTGTRVVPRADVLTAAAVVQGEPLASVDTAGIASRVAKLPGVGAVEVGRGWPHTITVAVTERTAVAVVQTPNGPQPVDSTGVVYPAPVPPGLPQLTFGAVGPEDPSTHAALDVLGALPEDLRSQVVTVDVALGGGTPQVTFGLTENRQVRWGPVDGSARKAAVLVALLTQPGRVYDVTSPALPTVRP
jgi:cell division protein FtsQ